MALNESDRRIRFGSCKRNAERLSAGISIFDGHVGRFLRTHPQYAAWQVEKVGVAPRIAPEIRERLRDAGHLAQDLDDLTAEFR